MKTIKDSIHDYIEIDGAALELLDTPPVQRLRHVKQLGTVHLVYPSANHTRFEHSLGVYYLARTALTHLGIEGDAAAHVRAAALLHDIGHPPYSHNIEALLERRDGASHENIEELLTTGRIASILAQHELDASRIASLVAGEGRYGPLVAGELDVDRMDYLVRDAHHTGVPYGTIDHGRLVRELALVDGELVLREGNVQTAENLLIARALMTQTVYNHHVARISKAMLRRAVQRLLDGGVSVERVWRMDDHELFAALRNDDSTSTLARRIAHRELFKRAVWTGFENVPADVVEAGLADRRAFEADIADRAEVDPGEVIIDVQPPGTMPEVSTRVVVDGAIRRLEEMSSLVGALREDQRAKRRFGVYTPAAARERVGAAAERVLGLDTAGTLVTKRRGRVVPLDAFEESTDRG